MKKVEEDEGKDKHEDVGDERRMKLFGTHKYIHKISFVRRLSQTCPKSKKHNSKNCYIMVAEMKKQQRQQKKRRYKNFLFFFGGGMVTEREEEGKERGNKEKKEN